MKLAIATSLLSLALLAQQSQPPASPQIPSDIAADLDVEYSRVGERVAMDILRPKSAGVRPAVLAIHGGGFRRGSRTSYIPLCITLARQGYVCATASYRLAPRHQFPAAVEDAKAAVRFLRVNAAKYGIDPARIGVTGGSAGGHLALMVGLTGASKLFEGSGPNLDQSSQVQAVVNYYGPTDFTQSYGKSVDAHEVLPLFLGGDLEHNRRQHIAASPLYYVTPLAAPTLTVHGTKDTYVEYNQGVWITDKLKAAGVEAELETLEGAGHGFKGPDADRATARLIGFFDKHLKAKPAHHILISDHGPIGEVVAIEWPSGNPLWKVPNRRGHDVQALPGGGVLFTIPPAQGQPGEVVELDANQKRVWSCGPREIEGLIHPLAAQRLPNGNTLIGDARAGKVIEVDKSCKTVWIYASDDIKDMRMRNSRRTPTGTTLIAVEMDAKIIEVDSAGKIIWQWRAPEGTSRRIYQARRLASGNTLISISDPGEVVEVDPSGKVVRSIGGNKMDIRMGWASGLEVLPGGNLLINDYTGRRIIEVDTQGRVVNELRLGPRTVASMSVID
jgi:acetyl esterase/lipase